MSQFSVNGINQDLPMDAASSFQNLLSYVRNAYVGDASIISCVRVNGIEINGLEEEALAMVPLNQLSTIEVYTSHPKEVAQDALQSLMDYTHALANLSFRASEEIGTPAFHQDFARLVDGVGTLTETVSSAREVMRVGLLPAVNLLEADLLSILKDVLSAQQSQDQPQYLLELLRDHLPEHLEKWRKDGIPALIRSRDS